MANPSGPPETRFAAPWPPMVLALMLWGLVLVAYLLFTVSLGLSRVLLLFPFIWVAHGLLLTWPLHALIQRVQPVQHAARWLIVGVAVALLTLVQALLDRHLSGLIVQHLMPGDFGAALVVRSAGRSIDAGFRIGLMIYFWVFGCYAMADGLLTAQRRLIEAQTAAQRAELAALRLQLHPHFLFNALNSVSALIVTGRHGEADTMAMNLATFLRASLLADPALPVALSDELETLDAYLDVERVRFGDRLNVQVDVPDDLYAETLPPFLLQPLVENAIKHGVGRTTKPIRIDLVARRDGDLLRLQVRDDGPGAGPGSQPAGTGTGLRNIRERLAATYGGRATLETERESPGFTATLTIPVGR